MIDPLKGNLIAEAKAEVEEASDYVLMTKGRSFTVADLDAALDALKRRRSSGTSLIEGDDPESAAINTVERETLAKEPLR